MIVSIAIARVITLFSASCSIPMTALVFTAGVGQIAVALASLAIPRILGWNDDTAKLRPLTRQIFWTYAGYIFATNIAFGLISTLAPAHLLDGSPLSAAVTGFIALYWGARVVIQFVYYDRSIARTRRFYQVAEFVAVALFLYFTLVYGYAAAMNLGSPRP